MLYGCAQFFQAYAADLTDLFINVNDVRRFMAVVENGTLIG
jgi:hypothetical protein